jgi:hypothetical protein
LFIFSHKYLNNFFTIITLLNKLIYKTKNVEK